MTIKSLNGQIAENVSIAEEDLKNIRRLPNGGVIWPEYIVLHHSLTKDGDTVSWQAIRKYHIHELGWRNVGYHYGIELVNGYYEILVGRSMIESGAHCKAEGMNYKSLGVCFVGNYDEVAVPSEMLERGINLVLGLMYAYNIPVENIRGHREYAYHKSCPGRKFSLDDFRETLAKRLNG